METFTIDQISVEGFKSIESSSIELGLVNVFIGANGSGKSNFLEGIATLAAAASGHVDYEALVRRGCRPGGYFRPLFRHISPEVETKLAARSLKQAYGVTLVAPQGVRPFSWSYQSEHWQSGRQKILDRAGIDHAKGDPTVGLAALKLAERSPNSLASRFLKRVAEFRIYTPNINQLRGLIPDGQLQEPVGLSGGGLAEAIQELVSGENGNMLFRAMTESIEWCEGVFSVSMKEEGAPLSSVRHGIAFADKYLRIDQNHGKPHSYFLSPYEVNEGALYQLFLSALCLHPASPKFLAIENADHGLNPDPYTHLRNRP